MCYQAAQALVEIATHYEKYYTPRSVNQMLEKVSPHFERVERYVGYARKGARLDAALVNTIFQLLRRFLSICAIYSEIVESSKTTSGKLKNFFKSVIGLDGGINQELEAIEGLVQRELLQNVADSRGASLIKESNRLRTQNTKLIREALKIDENDQFKSFWSETQYEYKSNYVPKTGLWLRLNEEFASWADRDQDTGRVLVLEAHKGFGKSYLCCNVIEYLRARYKTTGGEISVSVAYFYFKSTEKTQSSKVVGKDGRFIPRKEAAVDQSADGRKSVRDALRSIIWQLVQNDDNYQQFVAKRLTELSPSTEGIDLWDKFIMDYAQGDQDLRHRKPIYIILDGIDVVSDKSRKEVLGPIVQRTAEAHSSSLALRLFLTGTSDAFKNTIKERKNTTFIRADGKNKSDIRKYIAFKMKQVPRYSEDEEEQGILLKKLERRLCDHSDGDFLPTISRLDEIHHATSNNDYREILSRDPASDYSAYIPWQLRKLHADLTDNQIEEFNDVLICIIAMADWPTIKQLTTFLWLRDKRRNTRELEKRMSQDYFRFFEVVEGDFEGKFVQSVDTYDYFMNPKYGAPKPRPTVFKQDGTLEQAQTPDIALLRKVTEALCREDVLAKFDRFVNDLPDQRPSIGFDVVDGNVKVILCMLKAFSTENIKHSECFHEYTVENLDYHLGAVDSDQLKDVQKGVREEIGQLLYSFFMEETYVEAWLTEGNIDVIRDLNGGFSGWLDHALRWFQDPSVAKGATRAARPILSRVEGQNEMEAEDDSDTSVLSHVSQLKVEDLLVVQQHILASQWLQKYDWNANLSFLWFREISSIVSYLTGSKALANLVA